MSDHATDPWDWLKQNPLGLPPPNPRLATNPWCNSSPGLMSNPTVPVPPAPPKMPFEPPVDWSAVLREMEGTRWIQEAGERSARGLSGHERDVRVRQLAEVLRLSPETVAADLPRWEVCSRLRQHVSFASSRHMVLWDWMNAPLDKRAVVERCIREGDVRERLGRHEHTWD